MKVAVCGLSGFIGTYLGRYLKENGHDIIHISKADILSDNIGLIKEKISGTDVVINLAGAPISMTWTRKHLELMYESRVFTTAMLVNSVNELAESDRPKLFINTSAVGIYSSSGINTENTHVDKGYSVLNNIAMAWENECKNLDKSVRLVILRFATVLGSGGGVMKTFAGMLRYKVLISTGSPEHPFPWIYIEDLVRIFGFVMENQVWGVVNCVSPGSATLGTLSKAIKKMYRPLVSFTIPDNLLKIMLGQRSQIFTKQQRVIPSNLLLYGFRFECTDLESAFKRINL